MPTARPAYVLDAHALWWYWTDPPRLGVGARAAFDALEARRATALVPAIVVAELHYLSHRLQRSMSVDQILALIDSAPSLHVEPVTRNHLLTFGRLTDIPEMHDRLIGGVALLHDATLVSRDRTLQSTGAIKTIW